jgi:predicted transcriptional regulator YheO
MRLSSVMTPCGGIRDNLLTHVEVMLHSIDDRNKQMGARVKTPIELSEPLNETDLLLVNDFDARRQHDDEQDNNHQTGDELGHEYSCDT